MTTNTRLQYHAIRWIILQVWCVIVYSLCTLCVLTACRFETVSYCVLAVYSLHACVLLCTGCVFTTYTVELCTAVYLLRNCVLLCTCCVLRKFVYSTQKVDFFLMTVTHSLTFSRALAHPQPGQALAHQHKPQPNHSLNHSSGHSTPAQITLTTPSQATAKLQLWP